MFDFVQHILLGITLVLTLVFAGLLVLGAFLIYREWRSGNIPWRHYKPSEVVNHA